MAVTSRVFMTTTTLTEPEIEPEIAKVPKLVIIAFFSSDRLVQIVTPSWQFSHDFTLSSAWLHYFSSFSIAYKVLKMAHLQHHFLHLYIYAQNT